MINEGSLSNALLETFSLPIVACVEGQAIAEDKLSKGELEELVKLMKEAGKEYEGV